MRVALITDSPYVATGFGTTAKNLIPLLMDSGMEVTQLGIYHYDACRTNFHDTNILPVSRQDSMGMNNLRDLLETRPDIVLIIHEIIYTGVWTRALRSMGYSNPIIGFVPVYGPILTKRELITLRLLDLPIAFSEYGLRVMSKNNIDCSRIYLGVDHTLFSPVSNDERDKIKHTLGWDSFFTFIYIARNRWNKQQPKLVRAARMLIDMGITEFRIYMHCVPTVMSPHWIPGMGMMSQEWDLVALRKELDVTDHVLFPDDLEDQHSGVRDVDLVDRLRSADCVVHVAHGEGFGLPLVESLSCGVPVACTADGRVMQEIVGDAGILIDTDHMIKDASGNTYKDVQPEEWAQTMARIYHDFQDKSRMCNHRRIAYERSLAFDWKITSANIVDRIRNSGGVLPKEWHHG